MYAKINEQEPIAVNLKAASKRSLPHYKGANLTDTTINT